MTKFYLLLPLFLLSVTTSNAQPAIAAPTPPARNASDVVSLFSDAYTNVAGTDWFPNWSQSTTVTDIVVATDNVKKYSNLNYQGVQFAGAVNASSMTNLHIDIWTPNCTAFDVFLINTSPSTVEKAYTIVPTFSGWNSVDIPLSNYNTIALNNIGQIKLVGTPFGSSTVYMDNLYFWKSSSTPTISGFSVPAKLLGDAAFDLTAPTSNSPGAFSYTSSNTAVATIAGSTVTIVGAGTSIITANQAAAGGFTAGSTTANLVVTFPPPSSGPTAPTTDPGRVISLFSDSYTNVSGTDFFPNWGQSTVVSDYVAGTDNLKKYEYLNYQGIQLAASLDVSKAQYLHLDIWTPNATAFEVSLIKTTPAPTVEQPYTVNPTLSGWNSFNIPLSAFNNVPLDKIGQIKLVGTPFGSSTVYLDNLYFWSETTLPVKLVAFSATKNGNTAVLDWKTSTEADNSGFVIERSLNTSTWSELNFVQGKNGQGNSYRFTDQTPIKGINYYRLRQVDVNGNRSYSAVQSVTFENAGKTFSVSPNPVKSVLNIATANLQTSNASVSFLDMSGRNLKTVRLSAQNGGANISVNVSTLPAGIYNLVLRDGNNTTTQKIVIN